MENSKLLVHTSVWDRWK